MNSWWLSVHSYCWTRGFQGPLGAQGAVGCPLTTMHVNHFFRGCSGVDFLGVDLLGVEFGLNIFLAWIVQAWMLVWICFPPRHRQTASDVCMNKSTFSFHPPNPPPATMLICGLAAQWPCHCCSCHFSLTCESDRVHDHSHICKRHST